MTPEKKVLFTSHTANFHKFNRPFMLMLKQQGWVVHYASAGEESVFDVDKHFNVPFERSPFKLGNVKAYFKLKKIIKDEKYNLIHTHTPMGGVITRLAAIDARRGGTNVIYTAHGFHFFDGAPILNWLVYYPIEKFLARFTDTLVTINKEDYRRAEKKFKTTVRYVPGVGVDSVKFDEVMTSNAKIEKRRSLGVKNSDFVIIYAAEISERKNQHWLILSIAEFIKNNPNVQLLLAGNDSLNGKCQALVVELGIESQVHFLGYRSDIPELMKISDLSISSSKQEGLPVNVMESMYLGLPLIVTNCRGNRDLIEDGINGYVISSKNKKMLVTRITELMTKKSVRLNFGSESKKKIKSYMLEDILLEMALIYSKSNFEVENEGIV